MPAKKAAKKSATDEMNTTVKLDEKSPHVRRKAKASTVSARAAIGAREAKAAGKKASARGNSWT